MDDAINFLKKQNIGLNDQEDWYFWIQQQKKNHKIWSQSMNKLFEILPRELEMPSGYWELL